MTMKPALIIVDMLKDTFDKHPDAFITKEALTFVPTLNRLSAMFSGRGLPVIFSCDSFLPGDFIFKGKMKPHSIRGTDGAAVIDELERQPGDIVLPKRRFSAFFKTDLDQTLRTLGCDTIAVAGIATHICVLTTVLDAVSLDFNAVLLEDCCAAHKPEYHTGTIRTYEKSPLYPLIKIISSAAFIGEYLDS
jgi:nicotinamidase/pyrazinamidase